MKISGGELSRGNSVLGDWTEFLFEILFICLTFSLPTQFCMWICSGGNLKKLFSTCLDFWEKYYMEEGISRKLGQTLRKLYLFQVW